MRHVCCALFCLLATAAGAAPVQLTTGPGDDTEAAWSPDGRSVVFQRMRDGDADLQVFAINPNSTQTGVAAGAAHYMIFEDVDDDNVLDAQYLEVVARLAREYPCIGAFGGQARPEFESPAPEWTKPFCASAAGRAGLILKPARLLIT